MAAGKKLLGPMERFGLDENADIHIHMQVPLSGTMEVISRDLHSPSFHDMLDCSFRAAAHSPYALALTIVVSLCTIFEQRRCCSLEIGDESCLV